VSSARTRNFPVLSGTPLPLGHDDKIKLKMSLNAHAYVCAALAYERRGTHDTIHNDIRAAVTFFGTPAKNVNESVTFFGGRSKKHLLLPCRERESNPRVDKCLSTCANRGPVPGARPSPRRAEVSGNPAATSHSSKRPGGGGQLLESARVWDAKGLYTPNGTGTIGRVRFLRSPPPSMQADASSVKSKLLRLLARRQIHLLG